MDSRERSLESLVEDCQTRIEEVQRLHRLLIIAQTQQWQDMQLLVSSYLSLVEPHIDDLEMDLSGISSRIFNSQSE